MIKNMVFFGFIGRDYISWTATTSASCEVDWILLRGRAEAFGV